MTRQLLPCDVTAEDRARGCVWASRFMDNATEREKLGVVTGAPTINRGVTLNGTTDYVTYSLWGQMSSLTNLSFHCEFWPDFAFNDGVYRVMFEADNGAGANRTFLGKTDGSRLVVYLGATTNVLFYDASALWLQNQRNVFTFYGTSGNSSAYFNGVNVLNSSAVAWVPQATMPRLFVGDYNGLSRKFDGRITDLRFYRTLLTADDHLRIWEGAA